MHAKAPPSPNSSTALRGGQAWQPRGAWRERRGRRAKDALEDPLLGAALVVTAVAEARRGAVVQAPAVNLSAHARTDHRTKRSTEQRAASASVRKRNINDYSEHEVVRRECSMRANR